MYQKKVNQAQATHYNTTILGNQRNVKAFMVAEFKFCNSGTKCFPQSSTIKHMQNARNNFNITNLPLILHHSRETAFEMSKIVIFGYPSLGPLAFKPTDGGVPWDDRRKIFSECQWIAKVPNGVEILPKISTH